MSVIGTTLKQPRVFAHDAISLSNLPGCTYRVIASDGFEILDENTSTLGTTQGSGFQVGEVYNAVLDSTTGTSIKVVVESINGNGGITSVTLDRNLDCIPKGRDNTNLSKGDLLSIIWSPKGGQAWDDPDGKSAINILEITGLEPNSSWDYGCAFTPLLNRTATVDVKAIKAPSSYRAKTIIKYTCGDCLHISPGPGAGIYVGYDLEELTLIMESGQPAKFTNVPAGSFMPVSALTVCSAKPAGPAQDAPSLEELKELILVLF